MSFLEKSLHHMITDQPIALERTYKWLSENMEDILKYLSGIRNLFLVGCGDSYFASIYGMYFFECFTSVRAYAENAFEFLRYRKNFDRDDGLIAVSASGRTSKTVDAAKYAKDNGLVVLSITNNPDSPLAGIADYNILTQVEKPYGPPSATSTTALLSLAICGLYLGREQKRISEKEFDILIEDLEKILKIIRNEIESIKGKTDELAELLSNYDKVYLIGSGPSYVSALFGGAKLREAAWMHSIPFEAEEFSHYGMISLDEHDIAMLIVHQGHSLDKMLAIFNALKKIGVKTIVLTSLPDKFRDPELIIKLPEVNEYISPITDIIPLQITAIKTAMCKRLDVRGFRYSNILSKLIGYY